MIKIRASDNNNKNNNNNPPIDVNVAGIKILFKEDTTPYISNILSPKTVRPFVKKISEREEQQANEQDPNFNNNNNNNNNNNFVVGDSVYNDNNNIEIMSGGVD